MSTPPISEPVFLIEVNKITPNPFQPRRDFNQEELKNLAHSIQEFGMLQPLVVTKIEEITETGTSIKYQLIAGERRFRAAELIGLERVPAVIRNVSLDKERLELAIVENVQRADLNPIESARAYARLQDEFNLTQREIASRIGKSREVIANAIRLLNLPTQIQEAVAAGKVSESQARMLLTVDDMIQQQLLFEEILKSNITVRELKGKIDYLKSLKAQENAPKPDPEAESLKKQFEEALGAPVKLEKEGEASKITIQFNSPQELYALLEKLKKTGEPAPLPQSSLDNFTI